jgi:hypothetical protein
LLAKFYHQGFRRCCHIQATEEQGVEPDLAACHQIGAIDALEDAGLACPTHTTDEEEFSRRNCKGDRVKGFKYTAIQEMKLKSLRKITNLEHWRTWFSGHSRYLTVL